MQYSSVSCMCLLYHNLVHKRNFRNLEALILLHDSQVYHCKISALYHNLSAYTLEIFAVFKYYLSISNISRYYSTTSLHIIIQHQYDVYYLAIISTMSIYHSLKSHMFYYHTYSLLLIYHHSATIYQYYLSHTTVFHYAYALLF